MDQVNKDEVEKLQFPGSASNGNNALRTLRRMYSKAKEDKLIFEVPDFALFKEHGRSLRLNDEAERRLSAVVFPSSRKSKILLNHQRTLSFAATPTAARSDAGYFSGTFLVHSVPVAFNSIPAKNVPLGDIRKIGFSFPL